MTKLRRPSWRKVGRSAAVVLALFVVIYEGGANLLLSTGTIAHLLSKHPEKLLLEYGTARTFWPGRVHLEGFDLRGREASMEWQLHIDAADADISLLALLGHHFRVTKVVASGVTFRARFRLEPGAVNDDRVARMPPIAGFGAVSFVGAPSGTGGGKATPWLIDLEQVDAQGVREVWIDAYRLAGLVHATGRFTLGSGVFELGPARAEVNAALTTGEDPIATEVAGDLDAQMDAVDLGVVKGVGVLRYLTMHSTLHGKMGGVGFVKHFRTDDSVALEGGSGTFRSEVSVSHGIVQSGTSSHLELGPAAVVFGGRRLEGSTRIDVRITDESTEKATRSQLDIGLSDVVFTAPNAKGPAVRCAALAAHAQAPQLDLADPGSAVGELAYSWDAAKVEILDLHAVDETIPKDAPFHIERGTATMSTRGHGSLLGASAEVAVDSRLMMEVWGAHVSSGVVGKVPLQADFAARTLDLSGTELTLSDPALAGWWGHVKVASARVRVEPPSVTLAASTTARDGRPFVSLYTRVHTSSPIARTAVAVVPDALIESMTANLHGAFRLAASSGSFDLDALDVQGATSRLRGALKKRGERLNGGLLLDAGPTSLGFSFNSGKTSVILFDAHKWFETRVPHAAP